jgi:heme A synthase
MTALIGWAFIATWVSVGESAASNPAVRSLGILLLVSISQAILGVVQSNLGVPALMAGAHMLGAALIISLLTFQLLALRSNFQRLGKN